MPSHVPLTLCPIFPQIHTEAVTGVVGRAELLASVMYLMAILFYSKSSNKKSPRSTRWRHLAGTMMCTVMATLCKEQGITVVAVCAVYEMFVDQKLLPRDFLPSSQKAQTKGQTSGSSPPRKTKSQGIPKWIACSCQRLCVLIAGTLMLLLFRLKIMGAKLPVFTKFDNPAAVSPSPTKQLTLSYLVSVNLGLLLGPIDLCCDWTMNTIPLVESVLDPRNLATLATVCLLVMLAHSFFYSTIHRHSSIVILSLALMVFPFLPASNLFFPVGFVIAERK